MIEIGCDAAGCDQVVRAWHWATRPLSSMAAAALRKAEWLTVDPDQHYCPKHREQPERCWDWSARRANRGSAWARDR